MAEERLRRMASELAERIAELEARILEAMEPCKSRIEEAMSEAVLEVAGVRVPVLLGVYNWWDFVERRDFTRFADYYVRRRIIVLYLGTVGSFWNLVMSLAHEARHAVQHEMLGDRFLEEYKRALARRGYNGNPFQVDANEWAARNHSEMSKALDRAGWKRCVDVQLFYNCVKNRVEDFTYTAFNALDYIMLYAGPGAPDTGRLLGRLEKKARRAIEKARECCGFTLRAGETHWCRKG